MFLVGIRCCIHCGSLSAGESLLCPHCKDQLLRRQFCRFTFQVEQGMRICSFFDWNPGQSDCLSALFMGLKGQRQKTAWAHWAEIFWHQYVRQYPIKQQLCFIPAPGRQQRKDHASFFAESLAHLSGGHLLNPLIRLNDESQKSRTKAQRQEIVIESHVKFARLDTDHRYILVDDILTTGATARACFQALGGPVNFDVWVLGKRRVACGALGDLL